MLMIFFIEHASPDWVKNRADMGFHVALGRRTGHDAAAEAQGGARRGEGNALPKDAPLAVAHS